MIHQERDLALEVAPILKKAGALVLSYFHKNLTRTEKFDHGASSGFVTEADLASEQYLIEQLRGVIPEAHVFAEESGNVGEKSDYCWVIDPLDGTTNFAHGLPYFCISVGLTCKDKPVFGMIYQPLTDELFYATVGKGAFVNGVRLATSQEALNKSVIAIGLPYAKNTAYAHLLEKAPFIARQVYAIRHFGAVALDIAYVASGRLEGVVFEDLGWWDVAAGIVLVHEAGGFSSDFEGIEVGPAYRSFLAAGNPEVYKKLFLLLKP
ncbi:MAG: inositol monophosphatase family protein [Candidatus Dependentiae bacterium]|nr:inositol monophosphatase family protein [Candidatus Dependentiae bacterium]